MILCGSQDEADSGRQAGIRGNYVVLSNSSHIVDPGLDQAEARKTYLPMIGGDDPLVVCFGRYCQQKGQDIMLDAWPLIRAQVPQARLVMLGSGPDDTALREAATPDVVFATPGRDRESVAGGILCADVLAFPSRWETLSLAVLETFELGRPAVLSDCQGMKEAAEGGAGAVVPREDPHALADALIPYLRDRNWAAAEGIRAAEAYRAVHEARRQRNQQSYLALMRGMCP